MLYCQYRLVTFRLFKSHSTTPVSKSYQLKTKSIFKKTLMVTLPNSDPFISPKIAVVTLKAIWPKCICIDEGRGMTGMGTRRRKASGLRWLTCRHSRLLFFRVVAAIYSLCTRRCTSFEWEPSQSFVGTPD